jgi:hypothetical protein
MATSAKWFTRGITHALSDVNLKTATLKLTLHTVAPDQDLDEFFTDVTGELPTANGYTAGGLLLTGVTLIPDNATNKTTLNCTSPVSWANASFSAQYAILRADTGNAATSPLLLWNDAGALVPGGGGSWDFVVDSNGLGAVTPA